MEELTPAPATGAPAKLGVLFVCMGNVCRSPTAEAVFRKKAQEAGLAEAVFVESAGTHAGRGGDPPDRRSVAAAVRRGYELEGLTSRRLTPYDAERFDYVIAMDRGNLNRVRRELGEVIDGDGPEVALFLDYARDAREVEVPDPYLGDERGFETVLDLIETAADGLLETVARRLGRQVPE